MKLMKGIIPVLHVRGIADLSFQLSSQERIPIIIIIIIIDELMILFPSLPHLCFSFSLTPFQLILLSLAPSSLAILHQ